jgi:integrase
VKKIVPASLAELEALTEAMPDKDQLIVLLAAWWGLRFAELAELRRADVALTNGVVQVRRGVVRARSGRKVKDPKSDAGKRAVALPPHLHPAVKAHLREHAAMGRDGLLFPAGHGAQLAPSTLYRSTTRPGTRPVDPIYGSMTCGTPAPCSPPPPAPSWPS